MDGICPRFRFKDRKVKIFFLHFPDQKIAGKLLALKMADVGKQEFAFGTEKLVVLQVGGYKGIHPLS